MHRYSGRGGTGEGWFLDAPVLSQVNTDWQTDVYGDDLDDGDEANVTDPETGLPPPPDNDCAPRWEIYRQYLQSQVNGDILGVVEYNTQTYLTIVDRIDYSMFGVPRLLPTAGAFGGPVNADVDDDGVISNGLHPNGAVDVNDLLAFLALFEAGDARGDLVGEPGPFSDGCFDIRLGQIRRHKAQGLSLAALAQATHFGPHLVTPTLTP